MRRSIGFVLALVLSVPAFAAFKPAAVLPGVARAPGFAGSYWRTQIWLLNTGSTASTVRLSYRPGVGFEGTAATDRVDLQLIPNRALAVDDVLGALFAQEEATAGILVISVDGTTPPLAIGRTYTSREDGGTYGQLVPAVPLPSTRVAPTPPAIFPGLTGNDLFRSNVGLVGMGSDPASITVALTDPLGVALADPFTLTTPALTSNQVNKVDELLGVSPLDLFTVRMSGQGAWYGYASKVDQRTGDPSFLPGGMATRTTQWLDGIASSEGIGAYFRSTVVLFDPDPTVSAAVSVEFRPVGSVEPLATASVQIPPLATLAWNDVLVDLLALPNGNGSLAISGDAVVAWARTYNDDPNGTFGQFIPAFGLDDTLTPGREGYLLGVSDSRDGTGFRTNVGFMNVGTADADVVVVARTRSGDLGKKTWTVPAGSALRVNRILGQLQAINTMDPVFLHMETSSADAAVFAWASLVDNVTGDAVYLPVVIP